MKTLHVSALTEEEQTRLFTTVKEALMKASDNGSGMVDANFALCVLIQGLLLVTDFGVDEEWVHTITDVYFQEAIPKIQAQRAADGFVAGAGIPMGKLGEE